MLALTAASAVGANAQTPPPTQTASETIIVTAREATLIADAVNMLRSSRDPLISRTVADNITALATAMAASGRVHQIGPLTEQELSLVKLEDVLTRHSVASAPIRLQVRGVESTKGGPVYTLTRASFIALCADIASTGIIEIRGIQELKMIVVARMIADLNDQQHELVPEREILTGVLRGFENQDSKGAIIGRVLQIADAMSITGASYDLVPAGQLSAFHDLGHMTQGVFDVVPEPRLGLVNVRYDDRIYAATVNHFVWFFLRFLLVDQSQVDGNLLARRLRLGSELLDHVTAQLQANAVERVANAIDAGGAPVRDGLSLGNCYARGPGLDPIKRAPGLSKQPSDLGEDYCVLVVSSKQAQNLPDLRQWLAQRAQELKETIGR